MWPVTKGTFRPILHVTEMVWIPFRHKETATSSQVVLEYYRIVSGQLIMESSKVDNDQNCISLLSSSSIYFWWVYNVCESDTSAGDLGTFCCNESHVIKIVNLQEFQRVTVATLCSFCESISQLLFLG